MSLEHFRLGPIITFSNNKINLSDELVKRILKEGLYIMFASTKLPPSVMEEARKNGLKEPILGVYTYYFDEPQETLTA